MLTFAILFRNYPVNIKNFAKYLLFALPYLVVFIVSLYQPFDNDLGWHLAYGKYFFQNHQILRTNIFSTEMPAYHWVNSSWLTDLVSYATFTNFGFLGLSILAAIIITATFYFFAESAPLNYFEKALLFPTLLLLLKPLNSVSFRGQLESTLLLAVLIYILARYQKLESQAASHKLLYLLPPLFLIWSNLHGEFILGLAIFAIWIGADFLTEVLKNGIKKIKFILKEKITLLFIFFASALATLVNPFGWGVYLEALKHFGDPLQNYIAEWQAFATLSANWWQEVSVGFAAFFGLLFLIFSGKFREKIPQISIASILYLISFKLRRFIWPTYYFGIVLLAPVAAFFKPESKKYTTIAATLILLIYFVGSLLIDNPIKHLRNMTWQTYCQKFVFCQDSAFQYIIDNNLTDNLMTYYGWGGYLIWRFPQIKPSIDGRMHLWRDDTGYSAFEDYYSYEQNMADVDKSTYHVVLMFNQKPVYKRLNELANEGKWQKVYEDKFGGVFVRNLAN